MFHVIERTSEANWNLQNYTTLSKVLDWYSFLDKVLFCKVKESINMQVEIYTAYIESWTNKQNMSNCPYWGMVETLHKVTKVLKNTKYDYEFLNYKTRNWEMETDKHGLLAMHLNAKCKQHKYIAQMRDRRKFFILYKAKKKSNCTTQYQ